MSAICHGFVQNAWRKDICSNCFRVRDEHETINSVRSCTNSNMTSGVGTVNNNEHHQYNHQTLTSSTGVSSPSPNGYSNGTATATNANGATNHNGMKNGHSTSHTMPHPHSVSINVKSSPTQYMRNGHGRYQSPTLAQSGISGIPRIKTSSSTTLNPPSNAKGLYNPYDKVSSSSNYGSSCKLRGAASLEVISQIGLSTSSSSSPLPNSYGYLNGTSRRHPSKADKDTMNSNSLLTSSARSSSSSTLTLLGSSPSSGCSAAAGNVRSCAGSGVAGSKENILHYSSTYNNSTLNLNNNSNCASGSTSSACPPNANATSLTHPPHQFTSNTSTSNITKRNSLSSTAPLGGCSLTNSSSAGANSANTNNSRSYSVTQPKQSNSNNNRSFNQTLVQASNHPNQHVNGSGTKFSTVTNSSGVQMVHVNGSTSCASSNSSVRTNSANGNGVDVKTHLNHSYKTNNSTGPKTIASAIVGNKTKIMDETDGDVGTTGGNSKSKVTFGNNHGNPVLSSADSRTGKSVIVASATSVKGILKSKNGNARRKLTVSFPKEVCKVIGYGGDMNGSSSDEENSDDEDDEPVPDPQDSHSITELLEGNSTTYDEKELHTLTQKNTNFNSIKTNLLGITCIEIGPIVGCTGGKSMENSSKPLVSIGTFESRKEPLKIRKLGDTELPGKTFNNVKSMINGSATNTNTSSTNGTCTEPKKFVQKTNGVKTSQKVPSLTKNETEPKKTGGNSDASKNNIINGTNSNYSKSTTNGYTNGSNVNNVQVNGRDIHMTGNTNTISTVHVNTDKFIGCAKTATEKLQGKCNDSSSTLMANGNDNSSNHNHMNGGQSQKPAIALEKPRPKPILKNSQSQIKNSISSSVSNTTSNSNSKGNGNNSLSNLIIFTEGNNIACKRTSFLKDIINDKEKSLKNSVITNTCVPQTEEQSIEGQSANSLDKDSLDTSQHPRIIKSELKVDLKSGNNKKHATTIETNFDLIKSANNHLEFDDSLEDSGLDIKNRTEISESDEKSSSGSDSGNENDFSDRGEQRVNVNILGASNGNLTGSTSPVNGGLFISVDEVSDSVEKPAKLSPDSVLFSSASEMSASGSSESIPDTCDKNSSPVQAINVIPIQKRLAPRPPSNLSEVIYANEQPESEEEVYDDVRSFYKNPAEEELEEESLYDDCVAINAAAAVNSGKAVTGSYNFTDGSRTNDVEIDGEEEKVILQHNDGIEFIGIRKIDSETFLRQRSPSPKRERSSSASPKARRKVNQFFSTIGKKAGAAFSSGNHNSNRTKSPSALSNSSSSSTSTSAAYKRSLSTDEVSMTRTQEIYATLTPTSLKFKGLAPVLQKLSRMDLGHDKDKHKEKEKTYNASCNGEDGDQGKEKIFKKNKISSSIKKFLRFGGKEGESSSSGSNKYDFNNSSYMTKTDNSENLKNSAQFHSACMSTASDESSSIPSCISEESSTAQSESSVSSAHVNTPNASNNCNYDSSSNNNTTTDNDSTSGRRSVVPGTVSPLGRPPPPPPRVHSLDLLNKVGINMTGHGTNGTVRPARPPPPVRSNRVAPSFVSVFSNGADIMANTINPSNSLINNANAMYANSNGSSGNSSGTSFNSTDIMTPPNKPKRKASMSGQGANSRDLENTYNHITSLNLETLKLIASQTPDKIQRKSSVQLDCNSLCWSQFYVSELSSMSQGIGYAFYKALWEDEPCVLLVEESMTGVTPFLFECLETSATFEDVVPVEFVTWEASDYVNSGSGVKSFISVLPPVTVHSIFNYIYNSDIPAQKKYFALLQAMDFWHQQEMSNLIVIQDDSVSLDSESIETVRLYVHPVPMHQQKAYLHQRQRRPNSSDFEIAMKQLLLHNSNDSLLDENDRQVLLRRVSGSVEEVESQLKLFLQLKLFSPRSSSPDVEKIRKHRSERAIQQWLDRERALCMNEAVQRSIQRESQPISPFKKSYLEFLMTPENSAKAVLDMLVDLIL